MVLFESAVEGSSKDHAVTAYVCDDTLTGLPVHHPAGLNSGGAETVLGAVLSGRIGP